MEKSVVIKNMDVVARQRNLLLVLLIATSISCSALSMMLMNQTEKIVLVPGLNQEVWVTDKGVSGSYLEEAAAMYLPMLLDLESGSIDWKKERLMTYVSQSDPSYMQELIRYFDSTKEKYKKFSLSTHFAVKSFETDEQKLIVKASGQLVSRFGERGYHNLPTVYALSFEWVAGKLLLKSFVRLTKDNEEVGYGKAES